MATIYKDVEVEVRLDTDEIWEEVLDEMSTEDIEDYRRSDAKKKYPLSQWTKQRVHCLT